MKSVSEYHFTHEELIMILINYIRREGHDPKGSVKLSGPGIDSCKFQQRVCTITYTQPQHGEPEND